MPATKKKLPIKTLLVDMFLQPINDRERVVRVVAKAPIARAVYKNFSWVLILKARMLTGFPICDLMVMGTGIDTI